MEIKYRIIEVFDNDHQIMVRYYTDKFSEDNLMAVPNKHANGMPVRCRTDIPITLPIPEPNETDLTKLILSYCPTSFFEKLEMLENPSVNTSMTLSKSKIGVEYTATIEQVQESVTPTQLSDADVQELLNKL